MSTKAKPIINTTNLQSSHSPGLKTSASFAREDSFVEKVKPTTWTTEEESAGK